MTTSVVIPAHNAASSLATTIESALNQSVPVEVIVINDGSTDGTAVIADSFGDRVIYAEQTNQGQGAARNAGLALVHGDYVAFLDADDYWLPQFLQRCINFLEEHPKVIAVSTGLVIKDVNGDETILPMALHGKDKISEPVVLNDFYSFWAEQDHVRTGSVLIRKEVIDQAGPQRDDLRISQDLEYWGYLATFGQWGFIPEPLWVGNSRAAAAVNWVSKYRQRRKLCPTVESWEQRIVPRLEPWQLTDFRAVRGRVAVSFAHSKILGGAPVEALEIVRKYGAEMPKNRVSMLLKVGARLGLPGWNVVCWIVKWKEIIKAVKMHLRRWLFL